MSAHEMRCSCGELTWRSKKLPPPARAAECPDCRRKREATKAFVPFVAFEPWWVGEAGP